MQIMSNCFLCKHHNKKNYDVCKAFPNGIPNEIIIGELLHDKPYQGDNGIMFEPREND